MNMAHVTIDLPEDLVKQAEHFAQLRGISLGELIQEVLTREVGLAKRPRTGDPFFDFDDAYDGPVPPDLSINHDKYLYDEEEEGPR